MVKEEIPELPIDNVLNEPMARNTAACIAYAVFKIFKRNPEANCVVAPSDHLILDSDEFLRNIEAGLDFTAKDDALLTLGIKPTRPDTGYGYIQYIDNKKSAVCKVKTFTEKPDLELAQTFIESGDFLWNAGIFIWKAKTIIAAFDKHLNDMHQLFSGAMKGLNTPKEAELIQDIYPKCPSISIDYGVLEKAENVYVIPCSFGWSDLGTWASLYEVHEKDENQNAISGKDRIITHNSKRCLVNTTGNSLVVLNGVNNLVIVEDEGILLISNKEKEQDIKQIVANIKIKWGEKFL